MEGLPNLPSDLQCAPHCKCWRHEEQSATDRRLVAWRRNQRNAEHMQNYLCQSVGRPKHQLLMNSLEKYRKLQEERSLFTYAQVPCTFDKYRGNPTWWMTPPTLRKLCDEPQDYFVHLSRLDRLLVPQLEYVQVSKLFKSTSMQPSMRHYSEKGYMPKRLDKFCLKKIQPHIPEMDDVCVIGVAPKRPETRLESLSGEDGLGTLGFASSCFSEESKQQTLGVGVEKLSPTFLIINDRKITADARGIVKTSVIFAAACGNDTETHYLFVQNRSTWSLRIFFQETKSIPTFTTAAAGAETRFFFDRNYRIIMPGEKVNVPFWFRNAKFGFFNQLLKMSVVPDLWEDKVTIQISLNASTTQEDHLEKCRQYEEMIQARVKSRLISDCLKRMLKSVPPKEPAIKVYTFDKCTIFEALNSTFDPIHDRPTYLYDKDIVDELEAFYDAVRLEGHPEFWNLCLKDLRTVTKDREAFERAQKLSENFDHILQVIELNKKMRSEMRLRLDQMFAGEKTIKKEKGKAEAKKAVGSPKKEKKGKDSPKSQKNASPKKEKGKKKDAHVVAKVKELERDEVPKTLSDELEAIISKLQSPILNKDIHCQRFKLAYNLFCSYMDKITEDINEMCRNYFSLDRLDPFEVLTNAFNTSHMKCEQLVTCDMDAKAFFDHPKMPATAQPPWALEIPMYAYQARFDAMHSQTTDTDKTKATKKGKGKETKKETTKDSTKSKETKKTGKSKKSNISKHSTVEMMDMEEEQEEEEATVQESPELFEQDWYYLIPSDKVDHYRNNIYTVFYTNLCDFVDDLETVCNLMSGEGPQLAEVQRIKYSQQQEQLLDEGLQVQCVNLNARISQLLRTGDLDEAKEEVYPRYPSFTQKQQKEGLIEQSSSIWNVIKAYVPRKLRMKPEISHEDKEAEGGEEDAEGEEAGTEKKVQTSLCSDVSVNLSDNVFPPETQRKICVCGKGVDLREVAKRVSSFHNSECMKSSTPTPTTPDISSLDT